jgi:hypothetical protein
MPTPLCTLEDVKTFLNVAPEETLDDNKLAAMIEIASAQIAGGCGREFTVQEIAGELADGDGSNVLRPAVTPLLEVTALEIAGEPVPVSEVKVYPEYIKLVQNGEYQPRLRASGRVFPEGIKNISLSYRAGYQSIPPEIRHACILQVAYLMNTGNKQGVLSEGNSTVGVNTAYAQEQLAPAVRVICARYRRPRMGVI